jgi:hypothetical protein
MTRPLFTTLLAVALLGLGACDQQVKTYDCEETPEIPECGGTGEQELGEALPPRLYVDPPFGIGFDCVAPGCDDSATFLLENRGDLPVHITTVRLSVDSSAELTVALFNEVDNGDALLPLMEPVDFPTQSEPLVLEGGESVHAVVTYRPTDAVQDAGALWVDWYNGTLAFEDAEVLREEMPITTRVLGEAVADLQTPELTFGYVPLGQTVVLPVEVANVTTGTQTLALEPAEVNLEVEGTFRVLTEQTVFVDPGETGIIEVAFTPNALTAFFGSLSIPTNDGARPTLSVLLSGTAIEQPWFEIAEPDSWTVDFGDARIGETRSREIVIKNLGGLPLLVTPSMTLGADLGFSTSVPMDQPLPAVLPLQETTIVVEASPAVGGELLGEIAFTTNDPTLPSDWVDLRVFGVAPDAALSTEVLDFGSIVQSWTSPAQTLTIGNQGTGEMTIDLIEFQVGSSSQVKIAQLPDLPLKLSGDDVVELALYVQAQIIGPANATLLIHTDSIVDPVREVQITAQVVGCDEGCPMAGGTPSCASGSCQVGVCYEGLHDADGAFQNGCECGEDQNGSDVGDGCFDGSNIGPLGDDGQNDYQKSTTRIGTLHSQDDVDLYYFYAVDGGGFDDLFNDSFRVRVQFDAAPTGLEFCYRHANDGCGGQNQWSCGHRNTSFANGSYGSDDNTWVTVWVRWGAGYEPQCGNYSIRFRANDG